MLCYHFDGLVQDYSNSSANALELLQSGAKPSTSMSHNCVMLFCPYLRWPCDQTRHCVSLLYRSAGPLALVMGAHAPLSLYYDGPRCLVRARASPTLSKYVTSWRIPSIRAQAEMKYGCFNVWFFVFSNIWRIGDVSLFGGIWIKQHTRKWAPYSTPF